MIFFTFRTITHSTHPFISEAGYLPRHIIQFHTSDKNTLPIIINITVFRRNRFWAPYSCKEKTRYVVISKTQISSQEKFSHETWFYLGGWSNSMVPENCQWTLIELQLNASIYTDAKTETSSIENKMVNNTSNRQIKTIKNSVFMPLLIGKYYACSSNECIMKGADQHLSIKVLKTMSMRLRISKTFQSRMLCCFPIMRSTFEIKDKPRSVLSFINSNTDFNLVGGWRINMTSTNIISTQCYCDPNAFLFDVGIDETSVAVLIGLNTWCFLHTCSM